jgi:hypothetical protein
MLSVLNGPGVLNDNYVTATGPGIIELGYRTCAGLATEIVVTNDYPIPLILTSDGPMCVGDIRLLEASPPGGNFTVISGPGSLDGNALEATGAGLITIEYEVGVQGCSGLINQSIEVQSTDDFNIMFNDPELSVDLADAQFQWVDCENHYDPIPGETGQSYIVNSSGEYALIITQGFCVDTSDCIQVILSNVDFPEEFGVIHIVPNPSNGEFTVFLQRNQDDIRVVVRDILGRRIWDESSLQHPFKVDVKGVPPGVYILELTRGDYAIVRKVVVD